MFRPAFFAIRNSKEVVAVFLKFLHEVLVEEKDYIVAFTVVSRDGTLIPGILQQEHCLSQQHN